MASDHGLNRHFKTLMAELMGLAIALIDRSQKPLETPSIIAACHLTGRKDFEFAKPT